MSNEQRPPGEGWLTPEDVAKRKFINGRNVSRRAVYAAIHNERLKATYWKGRWWVREEDLPEWVPIGHRPPKKPACR